MDGSLPNLGFFLRADTGSIRFASRESASDRPELVVDGTTLSAVADAHLAPSTYQSLGEAETLSVGSGNNALLRFDVSGTSGPIGSATLRLYTTHQYGSADVGVFLAAPGRQGPPPAYETGLAAGFDRDDGIAEHPDVVFVADFEADDWMDGWTSHGGDFDVVDGSGDFGFEPLRGRSLRTVLLEGKLTALNTRYDFMDELGDERLVGARTLSSDPDWSKPARRVHADRELRLPRGPGDDLRGQLHLGPAARRDSGQAA